MISVIVNPIQTILLLPLTQMTAQTLQRFSNFVGIFSKQFLQIESVSDSVRMY